MRKDLSDLLTELFVQVSTFSCKRQNRSSRYHAKLQLCINVRLEIQYSFLARTLKMILLQQTNKIIKRIYKLVFLILGYITRAYMRVLSTARKNLKPIYCVHMESVFLYYSNARVPTIILYYQVYDKRTHTRSLTYYITYHSTRIMRWVQLPSYKTRFLFRVTSGSEISCRSLLYNMI